VAPVSRSAVVVGSGRSGTSLVAGVLVDTGLHPGDRLIPPSGANPTGFHEDLDVNALNGPWLFVDADALAATGDVAPLGRHVGAEVPTGRIRPALLSPPAAAAVPPDALALHAELLARRSP